MDGNSNESQGAGADEDVPPAQAPRSLRPAPTTTVTVCIGGVPQRVAEPLTAALLRYRLAAGVTRTDTDGRHQHGERKAWTALAAAAQPRVVSAVRAARVPERERTDCIQEAWLEALGSIHRIDPDPARGNVAGWLATVSRRAAWRHVRRQNRDRARPVVVLDPPADPRDDPAAIAVTRESTMTVQRLVAELPTAIGPETQVLVEQYMHAETPRLSVMATELGITQGQLWHRWRKTLAHLQKQLEKDYT